MATNCATNYNPLHGKGLHQKRQQGEAILWDERKHPHRITLTDTAWSRLEEIAAENGTSISEVIEAFARSQMG